ncbi:sugar transferase [Microbacterium sp. STN6]|uniref:sugar transferase n=1 Tax=Microbacterium sp. STN6 TaxID=2995588 RepID=UPI002260DA45|nr:sugar transferase [Microbacterium sp. STN6]MCX7523042.1 sugar transferase [Microbacterium sp. STN6]
MTEIKSRLPVSPGFGFRHRPMRIVESARAAPPVKAAAASARHSWARRYRSRLLITDTAIVLAAVFVAYVARFGFVDKPLRTAGTTSAYAVLLAVITLTWMFSLAAAHSRDSRMVGLGSTEYKRIVNASALTFGLLAIVFVVAKVDVARGYFVLALPLGTVGLLGSRWAWRQWLLRERRHGRYLSRALVVGRLEDVSYVVDQIETKPGTAFTVVGASLYDEKITQVDVGHHPVPVVSTSLEGVPAAAAEVGAETVIVAGQPHSDGDFIRGLAWRLEGTATELVLASRLTDVAGPRIHFRPVEGLPLIHVEIPQFEGGKHIAKRAMDIAIAGLALIALLPVMLVLAVLIRADSQGPVLFRQERVGRGGEPFMMLKFRSMIVNAESALPALLAKNEGSGVLFKMKDDPRVTRIGRVLRRYSLDELPQLWNVFIGDMSLVGPRPPLEREVEAYDGHVGRRLYIKPGLTGMWQVNGRSNLSWDESVRLDLYYVENWSVMGDLVLLWRTAKVVLRSEGAY